MGIRAWIVAGVLLGSCAQVFAASFPCYKASMYAESAVCSDPELSRQDDELAMLYKEALTRLPEPKAVQWVQKNWLEDDRNQCRTVQCVKDSYTMRIYGLRRQLGELPEKATTARVQAQVASASTPAVSTDEECANLNAAIKTAMNSKIPTTSLTQFGGRVITGWRQSDYDAFLSALNACTGRADVAPELNIFPDEAMLLLTTLRQRAVRIGLRDQSAISTPSNQEPPSQPAAAASEATDPTLAYSGQEVNGWRFVRNTNGVVMTSASRDATIYLGKDCDAMSPQYGNGAWTYSNAGWALKVGAEQLNFPRILPPVGEPYGNPPEKCGYKVDSSPTPQTAAAPATRPAPVQQQPAPTHAPVVLPSIAPAASAPSPTLTYTAQNSETEAVIGNFFVVLLVMWILLVIVGIVAGFKGAIVVYRNFDDLAIVFFMGVLFFVGGLAGFYFSGFKNSFATPLLWGLSGLGIMTLFGWTVARTWRDQKSESVWRFVLALITKMSLGILFVNNLVTLISPSGKTLGARSRARGSALLFLAVLTPIVLRLVRDHVGIWAPHNLLSAYQRHRMGV